MEANFSIEHSLTAMMSRYPAVRAIPRVIGSGHFKKAAVTFISQ